MKSSVAGALLATASTATAFNCSIATIKPYLPANATVLYADHYNAGETFSPPISENYGLLAIPTGSYSYTIPKAGCVVQANVTLPGNTQYSMGLLLPDDWNGRFL
jgi:feruloyl esterase